ncbi:hypothetical protein [Streptomyces sp. NPDC008137]|uniref:hypothetical protein n=1 Tax=Streptomyces sp. NPDC008137 TaxID=3364813 RepID=UPI0036E6451D
MTENITGIPGDAGLERGLPPDGTSDPEVPQAPELPPLDPQWRPSRLTDRLDQQFGGQLRERPRSRLWFPHLLIRGALSDTGQRPLWQPTPCWLSPDLHLLPAGAPPDLSRTVQSPRVGKAYTVVVHVWNLGRFPAFGVTVRAWWVDPGFFSGTQDPRYLPHYIGGAFTELGDRDSGSAHRLVAIPQPWEVQDQAQGHACLLAVVEAFADAWTGDLGAANADRHVAQRNLTLIRGDQETTEILNLLDDKVDREERLVLHLGEVRPASLRGAASRGAATRGTAPSNAGPLVPGRLRRTATLARTDSGWFADLDGGPALTPTGTERLGEAVAVVLGSRGTTAGDLLASPRLAGLRSAALHLSTGTSGYTVMLRA